jgi:hypothetical protein
LTAIVSPTSLPATAIEPPEHPFVNSFPRRCPDPDCNAVAFCASVSREHRSYVCAMCAKHVPRDGMIRCPRCMGAAFVDRDGSVYCGARRPCPTIVSYLRDPVPAWEAAIQSATASHTPEEWGLENVATWTRYSGPSGLARRFGYYEETRGEFVPGTDDAAWDEIHQDNIRRIDEMTSAIDDFGAVVLADNAIKSTGTSWVREFGGAMAVLLCNAIVTRGGQYKGNDELVRTGIRRTTPFSGYRHALCTAVGLENPESMSNGRGAGSLAYVSDNTYTHGLPGGILMQTEGMSVNPSRNGANANTTSRYTGEDDSAACVTSARIGGLWSAVEYGLDGTVAMKDGTAKIARCDGGRALTAVEFELLRLCDAGETVPVGKGKKDKETRKLKVSEALWWMKATEERRARLPEARHLMDRDAKTMLTRARRAVIEAMEAWQMIPRQATDMKRKKSANAGHADAADRVRMPFDPGGGGWSDVAEEVVS